MTRSPAYRGLHQDISVLERRTRAKRAPNAENYQRAERDITVPREIRFFSRLGPLKERGERARRA
jgi:hypothetical protein